MKPRLVLTRMVPAPVIARMQRDYDTLMPEKDMDAAAMLAASEAHKADAVFISSKLKLNAATIAALPPRVRVAASCSVGFEHIDVAAAKARGLVVTNTPEVLTDCTADLAFMLMLNVCRRTRENLAVMAPFEPGSVFKVITLSAALQTTDLNPLSVIDCGNGSIRIGSRVIKDHKSYSRLSMQDVLAFSSNVGAIRIGQTVGNQNLYDYIRLFGFGQRTGIELPAEAPGMLRPLKRWQQGSIGSVAMGHEISVTSVQLAQAGSVIANGGFRVPPRIVQFKQVPGGPKEIAKPPERVRVLEPDNVVTMRQMMERVVIYPGGTGRRAKLLGYTTAGKTGTAQIFDFQHRVYTHKYNASFMGFAPVVNPRIVIAVTVTGTTGEVGYGGVASAPAFKRVAESAMRIIGVPRDLPDEVPTIEARRPSPNEANDLSLASLSDPPTAEDWQEGLDGGEGAISEPGPFYSGPRAPKLTGMTELQVVQLSAEKGWLVEVTGHGLAVDQYPEPGAPLPPGERIRVKFRPL